MANTIKIPNLLLHEKNISLLFLKNILHDKEQPQTTGARHTCKRAVCGKNADGAEGQVSTRQKNALTSLSFLIYIEPFFKISNLFIITCTYTLYIVDYSCNVRADRPSNYS